MFLRPEVLWKRLQRQKWLIILAGMLVLVSVSVKSEKEQLVILQTADIHGKIGSREKQSGWAHVAGVVAGIREKHEDTLLIDCGDTVQGSLLARGTKGRSSIRMLDALDYDVFVPGNHETDFGIRRFIELMQMTSAPVLCSNLKMKEKKRLLSLRGWRIFTRGTLRIGVIGLTGGLPPAQIFEWHSEKGSFRFSKPEKALKRVLPEVLARHPDTIILAVHAGLFQYHGNDNSGVSELAYKYPEIDLVLGGHTHQSCGGRRAGYRSWYVQPGAYGRRVGVISITVDTESGRIKRMSSRLSDTADHSALRPSVKKTFRQLQSKHRELKTQRVGAISERIKGEGRPGMNCGSSALVSRAIAENTSADVVFYGKHNNTSLKPGEITEGELFKFLPYADKVTLIPLTAEKLEQIVAEQMQKKPLESLGIWGVKVRVSGRKTELAANEKEKYLVAFNAFSLASAEKDSILAEIRRKHKSRFLMSDKQIFQMVRKYIREHELINWDLKQWIRKTDQGCNAERSSQGR